MRRGRDTGRKYVFNLSHPKAEFELRSDFYLIRTAVDINETKLFLLLRIIKKQSVTRK